jgi:hypothetical protein
MHQEHHAKSGLYSIIGDWHATKSDTFPASQAPNLRVDVDRSSDRVTLTYERDGEMVVETYRIAGSEMW